MKKVLWAIVPIVVLLAAAGTDGRTKPAFRDDVDPIIFVHGGSGSGAQFASQAMRFNNNGYEPRYLAVVEYNSAAVNPASSADQALIFGKIDDRIAELQAATGRAQVTLMGHSFGTTWSHLYLTEPSRAAKVAHYVNIDGRPAAAPPGGVPTLALWAGAVDRPVQGEIVGATNVTIPNQEHVEVATSAESFIEMFRFLTGENPATSDIVREVGRIALSGRAVIFPDNVGAGGATLDIWEVQPRSGKRRGRRPKATFVLGADGAFSFQGRRGRHYEFALFGIGALPLHYFYEPFSRSDRFIRVNAAPALDPFLPPSPNHTGLAVIRYKEYWGDRGAENDVLSIDGVDVINPTTAPSGTVGTASVAFFAFDAGLDGVSDLTAVPIPFGALAFLTGADIFIPAELSSALRVVTVPRGDQAATRTLNIRRIRSTEGRTVVQLHDFEQ